jgi:2-amino-4-hydroxy-6-hydroxymethyldihydropteridine diphosphokinase
MNEAVLGLGTNLGNKLENLRNAVSAIKRLSKTQLIQVSGIYETKPFEVPDKQQNFYNCCLKINTDLSPLTLLGACLGIEASLGRVRTFKNASRIIDIDLLLYNDIKINTEELTLPHKEILKRDFVLIPLLDLYPQGNAMGLKISLPQNFLTINNIFKTLDF